MVGRDSSSALVKVCDNHYDVCFVKGSFYVKYARPMSIYFNVIDPCVQNCVVYAATVGNLDRVPSP